MPAAAKPNGSSLAAAVTNGVKYASKAPVQVYELRLEEDGSPTTERSVSTPALFLFERPDQSH